MIIFKSKHDRLQNTHPQITHHINVYTHMLLARIKSVVKFEISHKRAVIGSNGFTISKRRSTCSHVHLPSKPPKIVRYNFAHSFKKKTRMRIAARNFCDFIRNGIAAYIRLKHCSVSAQSMLHVY